MRQHLNKDDEPLLVVGSGPVESVRINSVETMETLSNPHICCMFGTKRRMALCDENNCQSIRSCLELLYDIDDTKVCPDQSHKASDDKDRCSFDRKALLPERKGSGKDKGNHCPGGTTHQI